MRGLTNRRNRNLLRGRDFGSVPRWLALVALSLPLLAGGCAKYNTFFNARRHFDQAEQVRQDAVRKHEDPPVPSGGQKADYETAIRKAQKVMDEYPGHSLTDDALFLQAKAYYRLQSYRMSVRKFDLLFSNFPATPYLEEGLYLQALNYLLIGAVGRSQEYLDQLAKQFPDSEFQSETRKVSGDNAYVLEEWDLAAASYKLYLEEFPDSEERDLVGLKLGECYWELKEYAQGAEVLQTVSDHTTSTTLSFQSRLLLARCLVKLGDFERADELLTLLQDQAEIYQAQGDVVLTQAEGLIARDRGEEASPLLENMPEEWKTPEVNARSADLLGYLYLERDQLEEAQTSFKEAVRRRPVLDDEIRTARLNQTLQDYLAAEQALPDAPVGRVARLKLLQANAMFFGFDRPADAARLYGEAAADTAADSLVAARALYGLVVTHRDHLDHPDSATHYQSLLEERYADSPQAFELRKNPDEHLLGMLLARRNRDQSDRLAALSDEERAALSELDTSLFQDSGQPGGERLYVRRRLVYLGRRENLLYPPLDPAQLIALRVGAERDAGPVDGPPDGTFLGADDQPVPLSETQDPEQTEKDAAEEKKKKDRRRSWEFDLHEPNPDPSATRAP